MKTNTAPQDYQKRIVIVSQLQKLCETCGAHVVLHSDDTYRCVSCNSTQWVEVWEHMADTFRRGLIEREEEAARMLATEHAPQMGMVLDIVAAVANMSPELEAELNRWIAEERNGSPEWLGDAELDGSDTTLLGGLTDAGMGSGGVM
jgi:ribosomal protein S27AE